ncbi:MAG: hypothetical protein ABI665_03675 [Vicinamibacterales bacterium]
MTLGVQVTWLLVLAAPVACVAWTVTHEQLFEGLRRACEQKSRTAKPAMARTFFYLFTCEYCFSHYVAAAAVFATQFRLLVPGWVGAMLAWFAVVWVANIYMSLFGRLRLDIKRERVEVAIEEKKVRRA